MPVPVHQLRRSDLVNANVAAILDWIALASFVALAWLRYKYGPFLAHAAVVWQWHCKRRIEAHKRKMRPEIRRKRWERVYAEQRQKEAAERAAWLAANPKLTECHYLDTATTDIGVNYHWATE
jgi:hypothetical protein